MILPGVSPRVAVLAFGFLLFVAPRARAERCAEDDTAIGLIFVGDWPEGRQGAVVAELRAALEVQDLQLCLEAEDEAPIASLRLVAVDADEVRVEVRDRVTAKRVERDLGLGGFPDDARALAIAVAGDELLRATWAELVLVDAPAPAIEPPAPVRALVRRERDQVAAEATGRPSLARFLSLAGELRWHAGGSLFGGGTLRVEIGVHPRVAVALAGGGFRAHREVVAGGRVEGVAVRGWLDLLVALAGTTEGLQLVAAAGARAGWVRFRGVADDQALTGESDVTGTTVSLRAGLEGRAHFGGFQLRLGAWAGAPLLATAATADGDDVMGTHGLEVGVALGVGVRL